MASRTRRLHRVGLLLLMALWLVGEPQPVGAQGGGGCNTQWANEQGYSLICDTYPSYAYCWPEWQLEEYCWEWCGLYPGGQAQSWGCSLEGPYQMEVYCGCWNPA